MYRYQLESKQVDIIFEGPESEYLEWAEAYTSETAKVHNARYGS